MAAAALPLVSCGGKGGPPPRQVRPVTVARAVERDVPIYLDEIGNCTAFETVMVQPQVSGPVIGVHFADGADVKKGDLLFTIDPRPHRAALEKARAALEQDRAKSANDLATLKRNEDLIQTKVISPQDLDNARAAWQMSQAAIQADAAAVEAAQINLDYCSIRSPIDGRASKRQVDVGNVVAANATQLLLLQRQDPIYVEFAIPENALPRVRSFIAAGTLKVQASFADDPAKSRVGDFDFLDSGVQQSTGSVRMRAVLKNEDRLFWPGQFVAVRILLDTIRAAVLVPYEAVQVGNAGPFVFVVNPDHTVALRPVQTGQRQGQAIALAEGVQAGETVVVTGQLALAPGAAVEVVREDGAAADPAAGSGGK